MNRYIDAEALKEKFINTDAYGINLTIDRYALKCIEDAPSIDIVRCGECKYYQDNQEGHYPNEECPWDKGETPNADDFCSYGERREP